MKLDEMLPYLSYIRKASHPQEGCSIKSAEVEALK
jgi:hypothetical protein